MSGQKKTENDEGVNVSEILVSALEGSKEAEQAVRNLVAHFVGHVVGERVASEFYERAAETWRHGTIHDVQDLLARTLEENGVPRMTVEDEDDDEREPEGGWQ